MKSFWKEFLLRGLMVAAGGPVVLAIIYGILGTTGTVQALTPAEVSTGILSITVMAFIAAGMTAIYQTEQIALPFAIAIHVAVLYLDYLILYLLNDWIPKNFSALGIFTGIFAVGFALVWVIIYCVTKAKATSLSKQLPGSQ